MTAPPIGGGPLYLFGACSKRDGGFEMRLTTILAVVAVAATMVLFVAAA